MTPSSTTLTTRLATRLRDDNRRRVLGFVAADGTTEWLSGAALGRRVAARRRQLESLGLGEGDVCLLVLETGRELAELTLAALTGGIVPLLVAPPAIQGTGSSLGRVVRATLRKSRARAAVCDASLAAELGPLAGRRGRTAFLFGPPEVADATPREPAVRGEADIAAMQLTSGTTGAPRICVWSQRAVLAALAAMAEAMRLDERDLCLNWTPLYHDMGLSNNLLLCLAHGVPLALMSPHDFVRRPARWLRALDELGATITWSPNFGFTLAAQRVRDDEIRGLRLGGVRAFYNAAERVHPATMDRFYDRFAAVGLRRDALKTNFGCAENIGGATFSRVDAPFARETLDAARLDRGVAVVRDPSADRPGVEVASVGRAAPGVEIRILSPRGRELPDGRVGELALHSPSQMVGYYRDRRASDRALRWGLVRTGDLGYKRGEEIYWVGRSRETINYFGRKLDPSDFEAELFDLEELRTGCFAVFGVPSTQVGTERVILISEVRDPSATASAGLESEIRARVSRGLSVQLGEVRLVAPGTLAKTSSGKRRHRHFRELYLNAGLDDL